MKVVLNRDFSAHSGVGEVHHGKLVPCFEHPGRLRNIIASFEQNGWGDFHSVADFGEAPIRAVHQDIYVDFLKTIWADWLAAGNEGDILPYIWPVAGLDRVNHDNLNARVGRFAFSSDSPIMEGTWKAAYSGAQTACTALDLVMMGQDRGAFALTRPPGHHAHARFFGGYCFFNNAAIAAQAACDRGAKRVAVLDIDYHHGNGTQDIFYQRGDVFTVSLHGDPKHSFPYFLGHEDEVGAADGVGANMNIAMGEGTTFDTWHKNLLGAVEAIARFDPEVVIVALGVDTFEGDPISRFLLKTDDYLQVGRTIAALGKPCVFTMEGGYDVGPIGQNVFNVLAGFEAG